MRVFITGGTGFIGQSLVERLRDAGHVPVVGTRNVEQARSTLGDGVELVQSMDEDVVARTLAAADSVVNLAGEPVLPARWTDAKKRKITESRVDRTNAMVRTLASQAHRPRVMVSASGVGFYGDDAGAEPRPERSPPGDDFLARVCVDWEAAARGAEAHGVRVVCVRIGLVLGREGGALQQMLTPFKMGIGGRLGSGDQFMPWIHLYDLVSVMVAALGDDAFPSVVNGAAPRPVTNREFTRTLGRVLGRPTLLPVPSFAMKAALGEAATALLGGQNAVPQALVEHGFQFEFTDLEACLTDILGRRG